MGDADITLRHIIRSRPEDVVRTLVDTDQPVEVLGWIGTQVTSLERRLDKALKLPIGGAPRLFHLEFQMELTEDDPYRIWEYQNLTLMGISAEAPDQPLPLIKSAVVVLKGRKKPWDRKGGFRTS